MQCPVDATDCLSFRVSGMWTDENADILGQCETSIAVQARMNTSVRVSKKEQGTNWNIKQTSIIFKDTQSVSSVLGLWKPRCWQSASGVVIWKGDNGRMCPQVCESAWCWMRHKTWFLCCTGDESLAIKTKAHQVCDQCEPCIFSQHSSSVNLAFSPNTAAVWTFPETTMETNVLHLATATWTGQFKTNTNCTLRVALKIHPEADVILCAGTSVVKSCSSENTEHQVCPSINFPV